MAAALAVPGISSAAQAASAKAAAIRAEYEALAGSWQLVKSVVDGMPMTKAEMKQSGLVIDHAGFRFSTNTGVDTAPAGKFTIDPSKNPKWLGQGQAVRGIYEILDSTNIRVCWAKRGQRRPTSFNSQHGSGWTVQYWRRVTGDAGKSEGN